MPWNHFLLVRLVDRVEIPECGRLNSSSGVAYS